MTNRPNDPIPVSPHHISDIWGKLEELEHDIEFLKEQFREQHKTLDILLMLIKAKWPEEKK